MKQRILLMADDETRLTILVEGLLQANFDVVARISLHEDLLARVNEIDADLLVIDVDTPRQTILAQLQLINELNPKPIVLFADKGDTEMIQAVVKAGVSAFVVDGLVARRIKPVIEVALARFKETLVLRQELAETRAHLMERKWVERAKGIIMKKRRISEDEAYKLLRTMAMKQNLRIPDVAKNILSVQELLN